MRPVPGASVAEHFLCRIIAIWAGGCLLSKAPIPSIMVSKYRDM